MKDSRKDRFGKGALVLIVAMLFSLGIGFVGCQRAVRYANPVKYSIQVLKDEADITANYDLSVRIGSPALIADFKLYVDGKNLITNFKPGQHAFNGTVFYKLASQDQETSVAFSISSNEGWTKSSKGKLRAKRYDNISFGN